MTQPTPQPASAPQAPPPSSHPALQGREVEARRLADAVRRLVELAVTTDLPAAPTAAFAAELEEVADRLSAHRPETPIPRFYAPPDDGPPPTGADDRPPLGTHMPYDYIVGPYNPLALPVVLEFDPPVARGRGTFGPPYEGAPGCVHGAALVATFDIVLTAANAIAGFTGPTVRLAVRYRRPTLTGVEAVFEGWVTQTTDRRIHSEGRLVQDGLVTVEAEGEFAIFDRAGVERMGRRRTAG